LAVGLLIVLFVEAFIGKVERPAIFPNRRKDITEEHTDQGVKRKGQRFRGRRYLHLSHRELDETWTSPKWY